MVRSFKIPKDDDVLVKLSDKSLNGALSRELVNSPKEILDLFVWNVYKGQRADPFEKDFKALAKDKDFILLQEAAVDERMPKIWQESFSSYEWHLAQSFLYNKESFGTGVAIGSTLTPTTVDFIRSKSRELFLLTPKLTIFSEYEINGKRALFVCTHVLNFVPMGAFTATLYQIAERISLFSGPVVLAGDFNTWNFKRFLVMKSIFRDLGFDHVELENDGRLLKLDHVFVRGFSVLKAEVHGSIKSSDHFPIELKIKL